MANPTETIHVGSCLGRTCLKWSADGDLTAQDLELVMERLAQVDQEVAALRHRSPGRHPRNAPDGIRGIHRQESALLSWYHSEIENDGHL